MAEQRSRPAPGGAASDDALATINEHLARFFQHADTLLAEWKGFGDQLRASMDAQVGQLNDTVAAAVTDAGRAAAHKLDHHIERSMASGLADLRREIESLARLAGQRTAAGGNAETASGGGTALPASPDRASRPLLWALVTANVMLALLVAVTVRNCQATDRAAPAASVASEADAGTGDPAPDSTGDRPAICGVPAGDIDDVCGSLARAYDAEAAGTLIAAATGAICDGEQAALVTKNLLLRLNPSVPAADEPGGKDDSPPDEKRGGKKSSRSRSSDESGKSKAGKSKAGKSKAGKSKAGKSTPAKSKK